MDDERVIPAAEDSEELAFPDQPSAPETTPPLAEPASNSNPLGAIETDMTLIDYFQIFVVYAFMVGAFLTMVFIIWGGINFILSSGNDEKIQKAVKTIRFSLIGLIIILLSFTGVQLLGRIFNMHYLDFISFDQVKKEVNRLVEIVKNEPESLERSPGPSPQ